MTTPLSLDTTRCDDGSFVVAAVGEIDLSNVGLFTDALNEAITRAVDSAPVTVDLTAVEYLDSGAISVLFDRSGSVRIIANPVLIPVLNISGLPDLTTVEPPPSFG